VIASDYDKLGVRDLRLSENGIKDGQYAMTSDNTATSRTMADSLTLVIRGGNGSSAVAAHDLGIEPVIEPVEPSAHRLIR
jgi:hypothetical protein